MSARIGIISEGTHKPEDLLKAFAEALDTMYDFDEDNLDEIAETYRLIGRAEAYADFCDQVATDAGPPFAEVNQRAQEIIDELTTAIDQLTPEGLYFGTLAGDGACFGVFIDWDYLEAEIHDGRIRKIDAADERPDPCECPVVLEVNDHGNTSLYVFDEGAWQELWSAV